MNEKKFAKEKRLSLDKVKKMAPYIEGATQCPHCKKWDIPENARAIYIPHKTIYNKNPQAKNYAYVLDAIALEMDLNEKISVISKERSRTIVRELKKGGYIVLKCGKPETSLDHLDYETSIKILEWQNYKTERKYELLVEILKTVTSVAQAVVAIQ